VVALPDRGGEAQQVGTSLLLGGVAGHIASDFCRRRLHDGEGWVRRAQDDQPPVKEVGPYPSALFLHDGAGPGLLRAIIARRENYLGANFAESFAALVVTLAPFGPGCFSTTPTSKSNSNRSRLRL